MSSGSPASEAKSGVCLVVTFPSVHQALKCEAAMVETGRKAKVMPVPRQISSSCGLAVQVRWSLADPLEAAKAAAGEMERARVDYETVHADLGGRFELMLEAGA